MISDDVASPRPPSGTFVNQMIAINRQRVANGGKLQPITPAPPQPINPPAQPINPP